MAKTNTMEKFFEAIEDRAKNYFEMTEDEKDEILADFANIYIKGKFRVGTTFKDVLEDLRKDIEMSEQSNRFELAAVMTDVRNSLMEVVDELDKQHKDQMK
jgi:hypothetical protein